MSPKKGGFVSIRHNDLRDLTAKIVSEVCKDRAREIEPKPEIESKLLSLSGEELHGKTTNRSNVARLDIRTRGFGNRGQQAFFGQQGI